LKEAFKTSLPSDEELRMVKQRWDYFMTSLNEVPGDVSVALHRIGKLPLTTTVYRSDDPQAYTESDRSRPEPPVTGAPRQERLLLEGAKKEASRTRSAVKTFWRALRRFCRHLFPCLRSKSCP
jgi:hypothetical protein